MFKPFLAHYGPGEFVGSGSGATDPGVLADSCASWSDLQGRIFRGGIYRVHHHADVPRYTAFAREAFPAFAQRITCFAASWLGNQFALDSGRLKNGKPQVLLLEPGTGQALEIPADIAEFHNDVLVTMAEAALAAGFFASWLGHGGQAPDEHQCVGYDTPLYLGGKDTVDNLSLNDFEVYWAIGAQLLANVRGLPVGTRVGRVSIASPPPAT